MALNPTPAAGVAALLRRFSDFAGKFRWVGEEGARNRSFGNRAADVATV